MANRLSITKGSKFSNGIEFLEMIEISPISLGKFRCFCGNEFIRSASRVVSGITKSCSCLLKTNIQNLRPPKTIHGESSRIYKNVTPEYNAWMRMKSRCYRLENDSYPRYGGRGITVCDRWKNDYGAFLQDMGRIPSKHHSLDRINNDGNYDPENCRWATMVEQNRNKSNNKYILLNGESKTQSEWAREFGISKSTLSRRLKSGWPIELALTEKSNRGNNLRKLLS